MEIPASLNEKIQNHPAIGLYPLVEIELNGKITFEKFLSKIYYDYKIPHKLLKADVEYLGKANYGKLLLHLQGDKEENRKAFQFFDKKKLQSTIKGYA